MKKIIIFVIFIVFAFGVYYFQNDDTYETFEFRDDFNSFDTNFWYAARWNNTLADVDQIDVNRGLISLKIDKTDEGPFMLSKPITVEKGSVLTIKRRVQLKPSGEPFAGGLAIIETADKGVIPSILNNKETRLGDGVVLVEYVTDVPRNASRPGDNTFRILPRSWQRQSTADIHPDVVATWFKSNYALVPAKFNQWVEEELSYDSKTGVVTYTLDDVSYTVKGPVIKTERVRLYIHGYGFGTGHEVVMDWITIKVE